MMTLSQIAKVINAKHVGADVTFDRVGADSRHIQAGQLFVALKGANFDGHSFASNALQLGASAVLVNEVADIANTIEPALIVKDTYAALGQIAHYWRSQFNLPLIAVTGSAGKTTVKEMLSAILQAASSTESVLATQGNLNNHIGMPMTLLKLKPQHQYAVIEMGMNHTGEIAYLSQLAQPNVALINNAGSAHIGELGSFEAIAKAKGEIFEGLSADGVAVINADDAFAPLWQDLTKNHRHITFGVQKVADVSATYTLQADGTLMQMHTPVGDIAVHLPAPGLHNVYNALAAASGALAVNIPLDAVKTGLESYQGVKGRLQQVVGMNGAVIIDDTYNANPVSMKAAIDVLAAKPGKKWLVLGDIGELGDSAEAMHIEVGAHASEANIDGLYTLGHLSQAMTFAFNKASEARHRNAVAQHFTELNDLVTALKQHLANNNTILVKGSRFMAMERVVNALRVNPTNAISTNTTTGITTTPAETH